MPLFSNTTPVQAALNEILRIGEDTVNFVAARYKPAFDSVWRRTDGITAQQLIEEMNNRGIALDLFAASAATRDMILAGKPSILPENYRAPLLTVTPEIVGGQPTGRMIVG